jgi:hypothetical protein
MPRTITDRKPQIIGILELLASQEQQLAYERNLPHMDISAELLCMWFDDHYRPDDMFFSSCFTADELAVLAEFHRFYEERSKQLPESHGTIRTWLASRVWREIMSRADETASGLAAEDPTGDNAGYAGQSAAKLPS